MNIVELLIGIAEIATALAGFTGVVVAFMALIVLQLINAAVWHRFSPFLAAVTVNLAGAAMQFARLIRSAFRG